MLAENQPKIWLNFGSKSYICLTANTYKTFIFLFELLQCMKFLLDSSWENFMVTLT